MKIVNYFIRLSLIVFVLMVAKSSTNVMDATVENENTNKTVNLSTMALKVIEVEEELKFTAIDTYTGDLTGYVYNCPLCNGTLACMPEYDITDGKNTYYDAEYGEVYIVASSRNLPCGSIVSFYSNRITDDRVVAIVLDRGVTGNSLDFLSPTLDYAYTNIGRSSVTYDVLRSGWE